MPPDPRRRLAIVLVNLGAPDRPAAIRPFLLNLFLDPAILRVPRFVRVMLAWVIASSRVRPASANYQLLDGRSPLLDLTRAQAEALTAALPDVQVRCFMAMRYWHPFSAAAAKAVRAWHADDIVLLPLYPQYSTTTTGSSLAAWHAAAANAGIAAQTHAICCYADDTAFARSVTGLVRTGYAAARSGLPDNVPLRVLFSAHGLPESIVTAGDPYQWQVERTVENVMAAWADPAIDWTICYQSRATPQKWLQPSTKDEIERAARDRAAVLLVPIAFVSEHSETLVELDIEYRDLAEKLGVPGYFRVPTQGVQAGFINVLTDLVRRALNAGRGVTSHSGVRVCPSSHQGCPCHTGGPERS